MLKRFNRKETYWGPDPDLIPWHEPDTNTAYGYDPFGNRIQIGIIAKRPMHHGDVARFRKSIERLIIAVRNTLEA